MAPRRRLPRNLPFRDTFLEFLRAYRTCRSYWYVSKARVLDDDNVSDMAATLEVIFDRFLGERWNRQTQSALLDALSAKELVHPYRRRDEQTEADYTALARITKTLLGFLGFLWVKDDAELVVTDAGLELLVADEPHKVVDRQVAKYQYPNPSLRRRYVSDFEGLLPHVFLLQVLQRVGYYLSGSEFELFVNLAQSHDDLDRICAYIECWRDLTDEQQQAVLEVAQGVTRADARAPRYRTIHLNASYQKGFHCYPRYLERENGGVRAASEEVIDHLAREWSQDLRVLSFDSDEDWFAYYGDPSQEPSWFRFLCKGLEVAGSSDEADELLSDYADKLEELSEEEQQGVQRQRLEKKIEDFYADALDQIEPGLRLVPNGRQHSTVIGRIDLLCEAADGKFVVVEIKKDEADDAVFGQLLRYIGWVHRMMPGGRSNVRGIIVARGFPPRALYSRIGLLRRDYKQFIKFKEHGLSLETM